MAPAISLLSGSTTITLNSGSVLVTRYDMAGPDVNQTTVEAGRDKQTLATPSWLNATETLELLITGATSAAVQTTVQSIEKALDAARQSARTWGGGRVYLQVQHDGDAVTWRSEILAGKLDVGDALDTLPRLRVEARLMVTRRPFWEGPRTALQLSTAADATPSTAERTLHVTDDSTAARNYIDIAASQVAGTLPAPIELQLRNGEAGGKWWRRYYLGNYTFMDAANIDPIFLGAASWFGASRAWTGATETLTHGWNLTAAQAADFSGQYCRMIAVVTGSPSAYYLRAAVTFDSTLHVPVYRAGRQTFVNSSGTYDLGVFPLPPGGYAESTYGLGVGISAQAATGGTLAIDHVQIMPAGLGLFRMIEQVGFQMTSDDAMVEDGPEGLVYARLISTGGRAPILRPYYEPLHIWPGRLNRLRVWIVGATKGDALEAQAWYRPRRLSI